MNIIKQTRISAIQIVLIIPLVFLLFAANTECLQANQKSSDELLLEIMDLHSDLVTNETFLAQAKMLGAYLEAAQPLEEVKKIKIYTKVLEILTKIHESGAQIPPKPSQKEGEVKQKTLEGEQKGKIVYEPGAALLEIFKIDPNKKEIPDLPVIRTYWKRDLAFSGDFLLPDRRSLIGKSPYIAKFSFYYEAKKSGKYGFTIVHDQKNGCGLKIGDVEVVNAPPKEPSAQGVCNLKKGFHRVEFMMGSGLPHYAYGTPIHNAIFQVMILTPDAFDAMPLTKDMMLLKKE